MLRSMVHRRIVGLSLFTLALLCQPGCGGGGGGGGTVGGLPVAPDPTCSVIQPAVHLQTAAQIQARLHENIIVPATSIEHASDIGIRAHTNHLILATTTRGVGPQGFTPSGLDTAYNVPPNGGAGAIALVDAFNYPTALNDFNVFSNQFSLPAESSSDVTASSNAVFRVVYATGVKPVDDGGWAQESALDTQWAHAMAPHAKIYLVEAASASLDDLAHAANVAKALPGVKQVVMSFGATETACEFATFDKFFLQNGVTFYSAAGDDAGNQDYPGESKNVVCCGGTTLNVNSNGTWASETAWNGTACGVSQFEPRPLFQNVVFSLVGKFRGACDIAADGDPATGVSVFDSTIFGGVSGWQVFGGTSSSAPILAGIANTALEAHASSQAQNTVFYSEIGGSNLHDVTSGSSGGLNAGAGWDFPTGVGSPNGIGGF